MAEQATSTIASTTSPYLLWARLLGSVDSREAAPLVRAYHLACVAHEGQKRDGGTTPYIVHPLRVALLLCQELARCEPLLLCVALLHDALEDSSLSKQELEASCGTLVAEAVAALSKAAASEETKQARDEASGL